MHLGALPRFMTFINLRCQVLPCVQSFWSLGNSGLSWIILWPTWDSCQCPMASPEERNRMSHPCLTALHTSEAASEFQKRRQPQCVLKVLSQKLIQLAQCLLNTEKGRRIQRSGGCAAAGYFLKPATKRQIEWAGESSRPGLQNTFGQLNNFFGLPGAQKTVWQGVLPASASTNLSCAAAKKSVVSHSVERQRRGKVDEKTRRMEEQRQWQRQVW